MTRLKASWFVRELNRARQRDWRVFFRNAEGSISHHAQGKERLVPLLIAVATALLAFGVVAPLMRVSKLLIFTDQVSLLNIIVSLFRKGDWFLALVVLAFSVVFPAAKLFAASYVWGGCNAFSDKVGHTLGLLDWIGRWSMLDVLVAALVVFSVKASGLANAVPEPGLYAFAGSVLTIAAAVALLKRAAKRIRSAGLVAVS